MQHRFADDPVEREAQMMRLLDQFAIDIKRLWNRLQQTPDHAIGYGVTGKAIEIGVEQVEGLSYESGVGGISGAFISGSKVEEQGSGIEVFEEPSDGVSGIIGSGSDPDPVSGGDGISGTPNE